ncbi:MAG: hypothetical protein ACJAUH_002322 [Saprospiraceae bacterium]|jgi:hypothetical protein
MSTKNIAIVSFISAALKIEDFISNGIIRAKIVRLCIIHIVLYNNMNLNIRELKK